MDVWQCAELFVAQMIQHSLGSWAPKLLPGKPEKSELSSETREVRAEFEIEPDLV